MRFKRIKNTFFMCANEGCHHLAISYYLLKINNMKPKRIGLCEDCSLELYSFAKEKTK